MELYIVRHGLSEGNAKEIFQGRIDFPLAPEGRRQADHLGKYFRQEEIKFDRIISSPLKRAFETAKIIKEQNEISPEIECEEAFMELKLGALEGVPNAEVQEKFPTYYIRPSEGWLDFAEFGGESWADVRARVDAVMLKYAPEDQLLDSKKLLIVSHGGAMRAIMRYLLKVDSGLMFIRIGNCMHVKINHLKVREHLRRCIEYVMPLASTIVDGKPYESARTSTRMY
jgi:broad specificity phosphatase PhoE